jgi:ABC-type uncharacterized transport system ATPase subunit
VIECAPNRPEGRQCHGARPKAARSSRTGPLTPTSEEIHANHAPSAIQTAGLPKSLKDNHVPRGIDLDIPSGIVFALLGANGAGKTTAINVLTTLLTPDAGTVRVAGYDVVTEADKVRASSASLDSSPRLMDCSPARRTFV